jgi:hypothetical protein
MSYGDELLAAFQADPAGAYAQIGAELEQAGYITRSDPRIDQMYADYQRQQELAAYDNAIAEVVSANPDVDPNRIHTYVAAAEGDFEQALQLYRADTARVLSTYSRVAAPAEDPAPDYRALGMTPQQGLHAAIEQATRMAKRR